MNYNDNDIDNDNDMQDTKSKFNLFANSVGVCVLDWKGPQHVDSRINLA